MKKYHFLFLLGAIFIVLFSVLPVEGQHSGFIISGANETNTLNTEGSSTLSGFVEQVDPRFIIEFARANHFYNMASIPMDLDSHLTSLKPRVIIQFAYANNFLSLKNTPHELDNLLAGLYSRIIIQFANANRYLAFAYPRDLIGDTTQPHISEINISQIGETSTRIAWKTNELADSAVECGTNPGVYTISLSNSWYTLQHSILVSGLSPEVEYFCRVGSKDLCGNLAVSNEFRFIQAGQSNIFLPLILK